MNAGVHAQQPSAKVTLDRTTILIGEPIKMNIELSVPAGSPYKWAGIDSIPHFEIVEAGQQDSSVDAANKVYKQQLIITSFDSGYWTIPRYALQSGKKKYYTDTFNVNVTFSPSDTAQDYHDIKEIIKVDNPGNPYIPWIIAAVTLLALGLLIYFLRKKKPVARPAGPPVSKLSPFEEATQSLETLRKENLPGKGEVKQYYTRLNDILRWYVYRRFDFSSLEKTNEELILQLRQTKLAHADYTTLAQALRMADFVKFAKYTPSPAEQEETFQVIKNSISRLEASMTTNSS
jgi:hypothetical protein